jgi:isochorismate synthase
MESAIPTPLAAASERADLASLHEQARRRAAAAEQGVLLCVSFPFAGADLLGLYERMAEPGAFGFYWERPGVAFSLAAGGRAATFRTRGPERFRTLAGRVQGLLETALRGAPAGPAPCGPYLLGGFSFFQQLEEGDWPGFDAGQLVVPAWLALCAPGRHEVILSALVTPDTEPAEGAAAMEALLHRVRGAAEGGSPEQGGERHNRAFRLEERGDGRDHWIEVVRHAREQIRQGRLAKVVLARALDVVCEDSPSPTALVRRLRGAYPDCYNFLVDPGAGEVFLGATPERMARFRNGTVDLAAMAGSMPRGAQPEADEAYARHLLASRKEREEHRIVVDGILDAMGGLGEVRLPGCPQVVKLTNVQHLYTPITLELRRKEPILTLLERIHPTAAVGGHPREEAFRLIQECERFDRGWYAAPVGWMNAEGEGEFAVALRSGTLSGNRLRLFAGGGIVADSDLEREFEETQLKLQPLLSALANE